MHPIPRLFALAVLLLPAAAAGAEGPWTVFAESRVRLISAWRVAPPGAEARLAIEFRLAPGWHVYWKNPGDAGYPPRLAFDDGALAGAVLRFPAPERFPLPGGLYAIGYANEVLSPIDGRLRAAAAAATLGATLDYLVCAASCIPRSSRLALDLAVGAPAEDTPAATFLADWRRRLPRASGSPGGPRVVVTASSSRASEIAIELSLRRDGLRAKAPDLFFEPQALLELDRPEVAVEPDGARFRIRARPLDAGKPLPSPLPLAWTATGFELAGAPAAWEGLADAAPPAVAQRSLRGPTAGTALLVFLVTWAARRRRRARALS